MKGHVQNGARGGLANVRKILAKILTVQPVRRYEASTPPGRPGTDPRYAPRPRRGRGPHAEIAEEIVRHAMRIDALRDAVARTVALHLNRGLVYLDRGQTDRRTLSSS